MSHKKKMSEVAWLVNRLRCMSIAEVAYRFQQAGVTYATKRGWLSVRSAERVQPVMESPPHVFCPPVRIDPVPYLEEADQILAGEVILFANRRFSIGRIPEWNRDPLTGTLGPQSFGPDIEITDRVLVGDIKHVWELNRHLHLVRVAQAFVLSGKRQYIEGLYGQIGSWLDQCPPIVGPNWTSSLELAIRLINWSVIWQLLRSCGTDVFKGDRAKYLRAKWLDSIYAQCHYISRHFSRHSSANNHLIGELAGLYIASKTWPYWSESAKWGAQAKLELEREALLQHSKDGVNREQAFAYQVFVAEFLLMAGIYGERLKDPFSSKYWETIHRSLGFLKAVQDVAGHLPMVGDADDGMVIRMEPGTSGNRADQLLKIGAAVFGQGGCLSDTAKWLVGETPAALIQTQQVPKLSDWCFVDGGYLIFGSAFGQPNEIKGLVDCGPVGYLGIAAHGHADALAVTLSICGEECLVDPGTFSYWNELKWREYFRGTSAHNTVRVDRQDQSVSGGRFMWTSKAHSRIEQLPTSPGKFSFSGSHDGYRRFPDPVSHVRRVQYDDESMTLCVRDEVQGRLPHEVEQFWHWGPTVQVELQQRRAIIRGNTFKIQAEFDGAEIQLALYKGCQQTRLGWMSRCYEAKEPINVLRVWSTAPEVSITAHFKIEIEDREH